MLLIDVRLLKSHPISSNYVLSIKSLTSLTRNRVVSPKHVAQRITALTRRVYSHRNCRKQRRTARLTYRSRTTYDELYCPPLNLTPPPASQSTPSPHKNKTHFTLTARYILRRFQVCRRNKQDQ